MKDESYLYSSCEPPGAKYLFHGDLKESHDLSLKTLQCGRQCDALKLYMSWIYYGKQGLSERVLNAMRNARYLVDRVKESDNLILVFDPEFFNICFWYVREDQREAVEEWKANGYDECSKDLFDALESNTKQIIAAMDSKVDYSPIKNLPSFFRMITSNYRLSTRDIDVILDDIQMTANRVL